MKIKALAPWYGCKRAVASQIVPHFGEHHAYWELFCGSMAMLFAKEECRQETVVDLHGDLINLARVVRDRSMVQELEWILRRTLVHEGIYHDAIKYLKDPANSHGNCPTHEKMTERAAWYFIRSWMGMNGVAGTPTRVNFAKRYTSGGGCLATRFVNAVDSIPEWHQRIRGVAIYQGCAIDIAKKIEDKPGTLVYADPPYIQKSDNYEHDFTPEQHKQFAKNLTRFEKTRVVVSYYDHPALADLYPESIWRKVELNINKSMGNARHAETAKAPEILFINDVRRGGNS